MNTTDLLAYITFQYYSSTQHYITKTKLLKFIYLVDLYYYRKEKVKITDINWVYYKFGPYSYHYDELIKNSAVEVYVDEEDKYDATLIKPSSDIEIIEILRNKISFDVKVLIKNILSDFALKDLPEILDFIYFETEPMLNAKERGENLSFDNCRSAEDYKIKELKIRPEIIRSLKDKYSGKLQSVRKL